MAVSVTGHLEECVDGEVVDLVDDLEGLDEVTPHPPIHQGSQPTLLQLFFVGAMQTPNLTNRPALNRLQGYRDRPLLELLG